MHLWVSDRVPLQPHTDLLHVAATKSHTDLLYVAAPKSIFAATGLQRTLHMASTDSIYSCDGLHIWQQRIYI